MGKYKKSMFDLSTSELFRVGWFTEEVCVLFLWQSLFTSALDSILQDLTLKANLGRHTLFHRAQVPNFVLYWGLGTKIVGWETVEPNHRRYLKATLPYYKITACGLMCYTTFTFL